MPIFASELFGNARLNIEYVHGVCHDKGIRKYNKMGGDNTIRLSAFLKDLEITYAKLPHCPIKENIRTYILLIMGTVLPKQDYVKYKQKLNRRFILEVNKIKKRK